MDTLSAVKVAIVTESFRPHVNGVANSVVRVVEQLTARGHDVLVIAPGGPGDAVGLGPSGPGGVPVELVHGVSLPFYRSFPVGLPTRRVTTALRDFRPDVVHLASPMVLGLSGLAAARRLGVPAVAVFQTDVAGFARCYGLRGTDALIWWWLRRLHRRADRTLAPSTPVLAELERRGVPRLAFWGRGVDRRRFHPGHRSQELRARLAPNGEVIIGYVGRLAMEKRPALLTRIADLPGTKLVVVGDGPERERLEHLLPNATFTGFRTGTELSELLASLDVFVHTGADETFCQAIQEALASGVPVVAPASGGPVDLVQPAVNGLLYAPNDPGQLRAAVSALVEHPTLRQGMSERAVESVRGRDWEAVCDELIRHYREIAGITPTDKTRSHQDVKTRQTEDAA